MMASFGWPYRGGNTEMTRDILDDYIDGRIRGAEIVASVVIR